MSVCAGAADGRLYVAEYPNQLVRTIAADSARAVTSTTLAPFPNVIYDIVLSEVEKVLYVAVGNAVFIVTYDGVPTLLAGAATTGNTRKELVVLRALDAFVDWH